MNRHLQLFGIIAVSLFNLAFFLHEKILFLSDNNPFAGSLLRRAMEC